MTQESKIKVTTTWRVSRTKYETFRDSFDEVTESEFVSWALNGLLDEVNGGTPELRAEFLKDRNERLWKKEAR